MEQPDVMALVDTLQGGLDRIAAPYVRALGLRVQSADAERVELSMPVTAELVHGGGVMCGQAMLAAADTAMVVAMAASFGGEFPPMTTVQLQTSFVRPVPADAGEVRVVCRVLRRGRTLAYGDVDIRTRDGRLAAHATTTYALL